MAEGETRRQALERLRPYVERARSFSGWDLGMLNVHHLTPGPPWDYEAVVRDVAPRRGWALDMGTGGGEVLSRLRDGLPEHVVATEAWHVNAPIADGRLRPLGVDVVWTCNLRLPFRDASFDIVINRHIEHDLEALLAVEREYGTDGGIFVTESRYLLVAEKPAVNG